MENQDIQTPMAFLVDGENASSALIREMLTEVSKYGPVLIRNVYGDWSSPQMKGWKEARLEHALQPVQQFSNISGKNATDTALIIDAMDMLHQGVVKGFCIVSSDSDFTTLAMRLRKSGAFVMGIGEVKTHISFKNACDLFVLTENLARNDTEPEPIKTPVRDKPHLPVNVKPSNNAKPPSDALDLIQRAYDSTELEGGYVYMSALGNVLKRLDPSFDPRTYGKKKLTDLIEALPYYFKIEKDKGGPGIHFVTRNTIDE